jgi:hypothetical protein
MIVNLTWNSKAWEDVSHDKSNFGWVKSHPRSAPSESWNFYLPRNSKSKRGWFQVQDDRQPAKFEDGGIIFFFSRNNSENKNYLVGMYAKANFGKTKHGNIVAPTDCCLRFYNYVRFDRKLHLPPKRKRIPQVGFTYITEKNAKSIIKDALQAGSTVNGVEENSDPRADFSKLTRIAKLYFRGIRIPKFQVQEINSITFEAFVKKEIPNFTSDDRITISKDNAKLKRSYTRHQDLLNRAIETLQEKGWHSCRIPSDADLLASKGRTMIILEAKSITPANQRSQIRNAVSQLYQYSYELSSKSRWKHRLVLVLERCPEDYWFEFCSYCNIELWYKENKVIIRGRRNNT